MAENPKTQDVTDGVEHESLVDRVVAYLKTKIIEGVYKPGERLPEVKIASELTVSRAPIREAYRILESEGWVEFFPRKGVHVKELTLSDVESIYILRTTLESLAAKLAIPMLDGGDMAKLDTLLTRMEGCLADRSTRPS